MADASLVECSVLIPKRRDKDLSDGKTHQQKVWDWLTAELLARFEGFTFASQAYLGAYIDPDTRRPVSDESRKFFIAIPLERVDELRELMRVACSKFKQKCIYLSVAGHVEFVGPEADEKP